MSIQMLQRTLGASRLSRLYGSQPPMPLSCVVRRQRRMRCRVAPTTEAHVRKMAVLVVAVLALTLLPGCGG